MCSCRLTVSLSIHENILWFTECATRLVMARKYLSDKELQEIINDPTFFDDLSTPDDHEDDDSDDEEEEIQSDDHGSKSEQEYDPVDDEGSKQLENGGRKEDSYKVRIVQHCGGK
nr:unnamed protein product [Callosobruchus analis]